MSRDFLSAFLRMTWPVAHRTAARQAGYAPPRSRLAQSGGQAFHRQGVASAPRPDLARSVRDLTSTAKPDLARRANYAGPPGFGLKYPPGGIPHAGSPRLSKAVQSGLARRYTPARAQQVVTLLEIAFNIASRPVGQGGPVRSNTTYLDPLTHPRLRKSGSSLDSLGISFQENSNPKPYGVHRPYLGTTYSRNGGVAESIANVWRGWPLPLAWATAYWLENVHAVATDRWQADWSFELPKGFNAGDVIAQPGAAPALPPATEPVSNQLRDNLPAFDAAYVKGLLDLPYGLEHGNTAPQARARSGASRGRPGRTWSRVIKVSGKVKEDLGQWTTTKRKPDLPQTKSKKAVAGGVVARTIFDLGMKTGDALEILGAIYGTLPVELRQTGATPQEQARAIWQNMDRLSAAAVVRAVIINEIQDYAVGRGSAVAGQALEVLTGRRSLGISVNGAPEIRVYKRGFGRDASKAKADAYYAAHQGYLREGGWPF